jgi:hypothetical protein
MRKGAHRNICNFVRGSFNDGPIISGFFIVVLPLIVIYGAFLQRTSIKRGAQFRHEAMDAQDRAMQLQEEGNRLLRDILSTLQEMAGTSP